MTNAPPREPPLRLDDRDAFAFRVDFVRRAVLMLRMPPEKLRTAVFLDERLLDKNTQGAWADLGQFIAETERLSSAVDDFAPVHFLFHISHCGSTLLSRMIDEATGALGLREPLPLRDLALVHDRLGEPDAAFSEDAFDRMLGAFVLAWRRRWRLFDGHGASAVHIKPTSSAQRLAPALMRCAPQARAVTLYVGAEHHIATLLGGPNNIYDMRAWAGERMSRLVALAGPPPSSLHALSPGELAALTWAAERVSQKQVLADQALGPRLVDVDFDDLLAEPAATLDAVCRHFRLQANPSYLTNLPQSEILRKYAKAPEHAYSPSLRAEIIANARRDHGAEIAKGLSWLTAYARTAPSNVAKTLAVAT